MRRKKSGAVFSSAAGDASEGGVQMGNEPEVRKSFGVEDAPGADAILRKMAKRALPDLQVKHVTGAAKEEPRGEDTMQRLIQPNLLKAARLRPSRDVPTGAASQ